MQKMKLALPYHVLTGAVACFCQPAAFLVLHFWGSRFKKNIVRQNLVVWWADVFEIVNFSALSAVPLLKPIEAIESHCSLAQIISYSLLFKP